MPVDTVPAAGTSLYAGATARAPKQVMDGEMFMSLLVTQLRNQDPSSPMDTNGMIQQTAQLASMEQLTSLTSMTKDGYALQQRIAAASILGREVSYLDADGASLTGVASSVSFAAGSPTVRVGTADVPLAALTVIGFAGTARTD
ncbi:MAG: flagellar hook capping protein [Naasia sp.]|nr:flagellar hook capping protein [Naasia sp.]